METPRQRLLRGLSLQAVRSPEVLQAIASVPRDLFVPPALKAFAWEDTALPIDCGQTISQPAVVALMTEALELRPGLRVLEIGTGSGYQTAILARMAGEVWSVERHDVLLRQATSRFAGLGLDNIRTRLGDGSLGWPGEQPFDRIMVTAAAARMPQRLIDQLVPDGLMVVPVGETVHDQKLYRVERCDGGCRCEAFLDVRFVPLVEGGT